GSRAFDYARRQDERAAGPQQATGDAHRRDRPVRTASRRNPLYDRLQRPQSRRVGPVGLRHRPLGRVGRRDGAQSRHAEHCLAAASPGRSRSDRPSGPGRTGREEPRMTLLDPIWLLLAVPLGASLWLWRMPSRPVLALRCLVLLLMLLGLAGLAV